MIKLNASYSKKVPVQGEEYSSQSFHCSMEVELSDKLDAGELHERIHDTFAQCREAVEAELHGSVRPAQVPADRPQVRVLPPPSQRQPSAPQNSGAKATNKQVKYVLDLAKERGLTLSQVNARCQSDYGVGSVYELDRKSASRFVDDLKAAA